MMRRAGTISQALCGGHRPWGGAPMKQGGVHTGSFTGVSSDDRGRWKSGIHCRVWLVLLLLASAAHGQEVNVDPYAALSASEALRQGNKLLKEDHSRAALEAYAHARKLQPEAPEIHFAEGLAHFKMEEFDKARDAFLKASGAKRIGLQNDSLYGLATCDHAEAMKDGQDPKTALSLLESAMQQYHNVLSRDPGHDAARDANARAASMWRQLKQQLQEQSPQQQECDGDSDENQDQKDGDPEQKKDDQKNQEGKEQQPSESSTGKDQEKPEDSSGSKAKEQQQQKQDSPSQDGQTEAQEAKASDSKEESSREQAQRRLREMVQALQQRKKARPERIPATVPIAVEKDW